MERQLPSPVISNAASPQDKMPRVKIHLSDVDAQEQFPDRILSLTAPEWSVKIGRGSQSELDLIPGPDNAWFTSRVMSRNHAIIRADPQERTVTIEDIGSMHGTSISGTKVRQEHSEILLDDDVVTFGAEVVRGPEKYQPLRLAVSYSWADSAVDAWDSLLAHEASSNTTNRFTADYTDEEDGQSISNSDDVQVVRESVRQPSVEFLSTKPSSPPLSSIKSIDSPSSEKHRSSPTDPTDVSDTEQAVPKKNGTVDAVSIPCMLNPNSIPEAFPYSVDDDEASRNEHMSEDEFDGYDVFDEDICDEQDEAKIDADIAEAYDQYSTHINITGRTHTDSAEQPVDTRSTGELPLRDPSPSDAALPKATSVQRPKSAHYFDPTSLQSPQASASHLPPPSAISIPRLSSIYDTANSHLSHLTSSAVTGAAYSVAGPNSGYGLNSNTWAHPNPMYSLLSAPSHSTNGTNPLPPLETYNNDPQFRSPVVDPSHDIYESDKALGKRTFEDYYSNAKNSTPPYGSFGAWQTGRSTQFPEVPSTEQPFIPASENVQRRLSAAVSELPRSVDIAAPEAIVHSEDNAAILADDSGTHIEERPRKIRKIVKTEPAEDQPSNNGTGFVKYAATALAGAALGAVGTVLGLAALPVDFFA